MWCIDVGRNGACWFRKRTAGHVASATTLQLQTAGIVVVGAEMSQLSISTDTRINVGLVQEAIAESTNNVHVRATFRRQTQHRSFAQSSSVHF